MTEEGGDLYLTAAGQERAEYLLPRNWHEKEWFRTHREVLRATGAVSPCRRCIKGDRAEAYLLTPTWLRSPKRFAAQARSA